MIVAERETPEGLLVAVCDREVLGETFKSGEFTLTVTEEFYGGDDAGEQEVANSLARATVANIVGEKSVDLAVDEGIVDEANVLEVGETVHAQLLRM